MIWHSLQFSIKTPSWMSGEYLTISTNVFQNSPNLKTVLSLFLGIVFLQAAFISGCKESDNVNLNAISKYETDETEPEQINNSSLKMARPLYEPLSVLLGCDANSLTPSFGSNYGTSLDGGETWLVIEGDPIIVAVGSLGTMAAWSCQPDGIKRQYYDEDAWGTNIWLNGADTGAHYSTPYFSSANEFTAVSHTLTDANTITSVYQVAMGVQLTQIVTLETGDYYYNIHWELANSSGSDFTDVRFFHGGDTYFGGDDSARSWWNAESQMIYVNNSSFETSGVMGFFGGGATPAAYYFGGRYNTGNDYASSTGRLPNSADSSYVDAGYHLEWDRATLANGETWTIEATQIWTDPASLQVVPPADGYAQADQTMALSFTVHNLDAGSSATVDLAAESTDIDWTVSLDSSSITLSALEAADVSVNVTVPSDAVADDISSISLVASVDGATVAVGTSKVTVFVPDYTISPESVDFGYVLIDESDTITVTISNTGSNMEIGTIGNSNPLASPFVTANDTCSGQTLANGENCTLDVTFSPTAEADFADSFNIPVVSPLVANHIIDVAGVGSVPLSIENSSEDAVYQNGDSAVAIDSAIVVLGTENVSTAKVTIENLQTGDVLACTESDGITCSYDSGTGILTLSGNATTAAYQTVLRTVTFYNADTGASTEERVIGFAVGNALYFSGNGHFYETRNVGSPITWTDAKNAAAAATYNGLQGYLATITSLEENDFVYSKITSHTWLGASDAESEGDWKWVTGPENGTSFWSGDYSGSAVDDLFNSWASGEPNDSGGNEDYAQMYGTSTTWNDLPDSSGDMMSYVVEYGGMDGDPVLQISDNKILSINDAPVVSTSANTTATEDVEYAYDADVTDADGPSATWSLLVADTCGGAINSSSGVYTFTPAGPVPADDCVLSIQVCDSGDPELCGSETTTISITAVNDAPAISTTATTEATEDVEYSYDADVTDDDGPGVTWSVVSATDTCGGAIDSSTGEYTFTPTGPVPDASCVMAIKICDGGSPELCDTETATITITAVNDAPQISTSATTGATEAVEYTYDANMSDEDGPGVTWMVTASDTCGGVIDSSTGVYTFTAATPVPAENCVVAIQVCDGATPNLCDSETATITITAVNDAPQISTSATTEATEDVEYAYDADFTANDGPTDTWSVVSSTDTCGGQIDSSTGVYTFTPYGPVPEESCVMAIQICDGATLELCDTETKTINITQVNDAPVISTTAGTSTSEDTQYSYDANITDPDGTGATWTVTGLDTCNGIINESTGVYTFSPANPGYCVMAIQICDGGTPDLCDTETAIINISDVNECTAGIHNCDPLTTCTNTIGGFVCSACPSGYTDTNGDGTQCDDINECTLGADNCDSLTTCTNTTGAFTCSACPSGYTDTNGDGTLCVDINECTAQTDNCDDLTTCINNVGGFTCSACPSGYADTNSDGTLCVDINECSLGTDNCDSLTMCTNTAGGFTCSECPSGYTDTNGDGTLCNDINECTAQLDNCDDLTTCINNVGGFFCSACPSGYADTNSDGTECVDINECTLGTDNCDSLTTCTNTAGGFSCSACPSGYTDTNSDGTLCTDNNECTLETDNCDPLVNCINTAGGFTCGACPSGYTDVNDDGTECVDIDECVLGMDTCDALTDCTNTVGGYTCSACPPGFTDTFDDGTECMDIDECALETHDCTGLTTCINTAGSFACSNCPSGYFDTNGDGTQCDDIDECAQGTDNCDPLTTCTNSEGSFTCGACPTGYDDVNLDGTYCADIDECAEGADNCDDLTPCRNIRGSFICSLCPAGYTDVFGDGSNCLDINECKLGTDNCDSQTTCTNTKGGFTCSSCPSGYTDARNDGTHCIDINECWGDGHDCDELTTCRNTAGSFTCTACPSGYTDTWNDGTECADINECALGIDNCDSLTTCTNTVGGFTCSSCPAGYTDTNGDGTQCNDINECEANLDNCDDLTPCHNTLGGFICSVCPAGFTDTNGDGSQCDDIDECTLGTDNCDALTNCLNTEGGFTCSACPSGYTDTNSDGTRCEDIDECQLGADNCDSLTTCANIAGSFTCGACPSGYTDIYGDGTQCEDIDECAAGTDNCDYLNPCNNTPGGFTCSACPSGYTDVYGDGTQCDDMNECVLGADNCDALTSCVNTEGSFTCSACPYGYTDIHGDGTQCVDINECETDAHDCDELTSCSNTAGSFTCSACPAGYTDTNDDGSQCIDIDECTLGTDNCDSLTTCTNTAGGFICSACPSGYTDTYGDGTRCDDINECTGVASSNCGVGNGGACMNLGGTFLCTECPNGYALADDRMSCVEIDECLLNMDACDENATCENTDGSYICTCNKGASGDGFSCTATEFAGLPEDGAAVQGQNLPVSGIGEPGTLVTVAVDGKVGCTATVNASGNWECSVAGLSDGTHTIAVEGPNEAGEEVTVWVDNTTSVSSATPAGGSSTFKESPSEITGTGEAGASIVATIDGVAVCTTVVDASGNWICDIGLSMAGGAHDIAIIATDEAGNEDTSAFTWIVDNTTTGDINKVSVNTNSPTTVLDGTGEPGATVTVAVDGTQYTTTVDETGHWTVEVPTPTEAGEHYVDVLITDAAGNTKTASETFEVEEPIDKTSIEESSNSVSGGVSCSVNGAPTGSNEGVIMILLLLAGLSLLKKGVKK
ncbi:MAG: choice-of-anchor D domain-containing protein [Deltaproteobacteria bacterium]|nr:choice-of-anchor D domain-containing protein [Deltaproteobacteria bacterium]